MGMKKQNWKQIFGWRASRYYFGVCPMWEDNTKMSLGKISCNNVNWNRWLRRDLSGRIL
jgi:hypothetical protein